MFLKRKLKKHLASAAEFAQNAEFHRQLGDIYYELKQWYPAVAEYRTSVTIGNGDPGLGLALAEAYLAAGQVNHAIALCEKILKEGEEQVLNEARKLLENAATKGERSLVSISPNRYQRLKRLADYLDDLYDDSDLSILDVGGGDGMLCLFLPRAQYVLAEPDINGISGVALPFAEKSFDAVIACHVLEHIPRSERSMFLKQLCEKAKRHVLLLNPFFDPNGQRGLNLIEELTKAPWAQEHLACEMPKLEEVEQFVAEHNYTINIYPNGSKITSIACVFLEYYANLAKRGSDLERINTLFNALFYESMTNSLPNDYLIEINVGK